MKTFKGLMEIIAKDVKDDLKYMDSEAFSKKHGKKKNELKGFEEDANMTLDAQINEVLSKDASAGEWIRDFVHTDNPKFAGKSKAERKKMALGAYYGKQNEATIAGTSGWKKMPSTVTDKSGAKHSPMSRARDLAQQAFKKVQDKTKVK